MNQNRKSLKDRAAEMTVLLPFMEGREKGNMSDLLDKTVTITDYGFLPGKLDKKTGITGADYPCFIIDEDPASFYFGGAVLQDRLLQFDREGYHEDITAEGLPVRFSARKNAEGRPYTGVELYPDEAMKPAAKK